MSTPALLSREEIDRRLAVLPRWETRGKTLEWKHRFPSFREAMGFVNRVADLAELHDHHPDFVVHHRDVTLVLWTHVAGGVTERDLALAAEIERLE